MMQHAQSAAMTRRALLKSTSCGFGYLALAGLAAESAAAERGYQNPLAAKSPHFEPKAKRVIFLFMQGGPSHVDTFDFKPALQSSGGKQVDYQYKGKTQKEKLLPSPWKFPKQGESGLPISELYPELSRHADDLCLLNGMHTDNPAHPQATIAVHTGSTSLVRPSVGSWVLYGLGTSNQDLPGFLAINPLTRLGGAQNYGSAFLPAAYQATRINAANRSSIPNIANRDLSDAEQRRQLDLLQAMNRDLLETSTGNHEIEGLIESYELAFRMQSAVPGVMDFSTESKATMEKYGIDGGPTVNFGRQCLLARRFAEAGVRYIELTHSGWDQHNGLRKKLASNALATDKPIAALIGDLKQRDMLKDTLIVWGGEFGRTPSAQGNGDGRRHNNRGYSMWMCGGGVKGGIRYGETDDYGFQSVANKMHIHDLHATMLHLLGMNHEKLTYRYAGRDFRLTDVYGRVATEVLA